MKIFKILFAFALGVSLFSSCIKDDTSRELSSLERPQLVNPDKDPALLINHHVYNVKRGDDLVLTPQISYSNMADLSYEWLINGEVVSTSKDLKWNYALDIKDERVFGTLIVHINSINDAEVFGFTVNQYNPYQAGYMILARKNGKTNMHFIQDLLLQGKYLYEFTENAPVIDFQGNGRLVEYWSRESNQTIGEIMYIDSNRENTFSISGKTFEREVALKDEFRNGVFPAGMGNLVDVMHTGMRSYALDDNGSVYMCPRGVGNYTGFYYDFPMEFNGSPLKITHFCSPNRYSTSMAAMYNADTDKFYALYIGFETGSSAPSALSGSLMEVSALSGKAAGKELVWMKQMKDANYFIMLGLYKDAANKYYLRQSQFSYNGETLSSVKDFYASTFVELTDVTASSVIHAIHWPTPMMAGCDFANIIYTNGIDNKTVYMRTREATGVSAPRKFAEFDKDVVAICVDKAGRTHANVMFGFADGTLEHYAVITGSVNDGFARELDKSMILTDGGIDAINLGEILSIEFKYGTLASN